MATTDTDGDGFYTLIATTGEAVIAHYFQGDVCLCGAYGGRAIGRLPITKVRWQSMRNSNANKNLPATSPVCEECQELNARRWAGVKEGKSEGASS